MSRSISATSSLENKYISCLLTIDHKLASIYGHLNWTEVMFDLSAYQKKRKKKRSLIDQTILPSSAWKDLSDPSSFKATGWSGPKTSPDASWGSRKSHLAEQS